MKKIVVGLSGGVDSAVSLFLLGKQSGFESSAVFMQNWDDFLHGSQTIKRRCTQTEDWDDAVSVAKHLAVDLKKVNFIDDYWNKVFVSFLEKMKDGVTPNPDIVCNSAIKFSRFFEYARNQLGADFLATGHYAKIIFVEETGDYFLAKPLDQSKDQTYFLCQIDYRLLPFLKFPLANFTKKQVREIAKEQRISNSTKKDSTGICFIGEKDFTTFISQYLPTKEGDVIDINSSQLLSKHQGFFLFTIGQRKNLQISGAKGPHYVVGKDYKKNVVYVTNIQNDHRLYSAYCSVDEFNWLLPQQKIESFLQKPLTAKFRYRQEEVPVSLQLVDQDCKKVLIKLHQRKVKAITPGQYAVVYSDQICLGGGLIVSTEFLDKNCKIIEKK